MKPIRLLLAVSLTVNAALVALFLAGAVTTDGSRASGRDIEATAPSLKVGAPPPSTLTPAEPGPETWAMLSAGDFSARQARLRALGFSPSLTRSILLAQIRTAYAPRLRELEMIFQRSPYFRPKELTGDALAELRKLSREENRRIRELLGPDLDSASARAVREALPNASDDKIAQLAAIRENYEQMRQDFTGGSRAPLQIDEREKYFALDNAMRAEIANLLTPQELEDYDLFAGGGADRARSSLAGIDVTEAEFRAFYRIQNAMNAQNSPIFTPPTADEMRARNEARKQSMDQIAALLGSERYADWMRVNDYSYRQTAQLVTRLEMPVAVANKVYVVQKEIQQRAAALQSDRTLPPQDQATQLAALASEAQTKITAVLGAAGYEAYKQFGGSWLQMFQPRPASPRN